MGQRCVPDDGANSQLGHGTKAAIVYDCGSEMDL